MSEALARPADEERGGERAPGRGLYVAGDDRFRVAVEQHPDAFALCAAVRDETDEVVDLRIEYLNAAARRQVAAADGDGAERPLWDHPALASSLRRVVETGEPFDEEAFATVERSGSGAPVERAWQVHAVRAGDAVAVSWRPADGAGRTGELPATEQFRLLAAVERIDEGILLTDGNGRIAYANPALHALFGFVPGELTGQSPGILGPDQTQADMRSLMAAVRSGRSWSGAVQAARRDGTPFIAAVSMTPLPPRAGSEQPVAWAGTVRDLSTEVTAESHLFRSQTMEAVGRLAGGGAHDFNNLLTAVRGYAELLEEEFEPDDPRLEYVSDILKASDRAAAVTRQLLAFGRRQMLRPDVLDVHEVVIDVLPILRRLVGEDIEIAEDAAPDLGFVRADRTQLEQVLLNLVVNARDAMPGGGHVEIEMRNATMDVTYAATHPAAQPGDYVMVSVTDSGRGMDRETLRHVFEPFYTTKRQGSGTGLGLATVYGIVKQSGGYVWAYSEVGIGPTFKVYLPQGPAQTGRSGGRRSPAADRGSGEPRGAAPRGTEVVLVVEDEDAVRSFVRSVLERLGYTVLAAPDGRTALDVLADGRRVDLLLTDVVMPGMSGPELAERLQADQPDLRILYASGYAQAAMTQRGVLRRGTSFLPKPFSSGELARRVRAVLDAVPS